MESAGEPRLLGAAGFLKVLDGSWWYEDEAEGQIKPKLSPLPRRRGSESSDDSEPEPPSTRPRKVRFADAVGLSLVSVKEFDSRDASGPACSDAPDSGARDSEEYFLSSLFSVPSSAEELLQRLDERKCELECVELLPGTTALRGIVRVLNLGFRKAVYVRTSLDGWCTHFDLLAEFVPGSSDGETDRFMFKLTLVPPFEKEGAKVEFCLRYETSGATFWANNNGMNYVLFCHQRAVRDARDRQQEGNNHKQKKSCLKASSKDSSLEASPKRTPLETQGTTTQTQDTGVRNPVENHVPHPEVPREDDRQKSPVDSNRDSSWRSRRRSARLARIRNRFYLKDTEALEGGVSSQEEDTRYAETMSEISSSPYWATTSNLPGVPDRNQTNGTEKPSTRDQIPWSSLKSDRDGAFPFRPETNGAWDRANSDTLADVGDARTARHTKELEGRVPPDLIGSAAHPVETFARWSDSTDRPHVARGNPRSSRNQLVIEGKASTCEHAQTETTDLCNCREGAESLEIAQGDMVEDQASSERADEHKTTRHRLWTDGVNIRLPFPAGDQLESPDGALESAPGDLLKADASTAGHKDHTYSQGGDAFHGSRSPNHQATRDLIADNGIEHDAQRVGRHGGRGEGNLSTVEFAELTSSLGEADTVREAAVTLDSPRPEVANGMSLECDDSFASSAMDIRTDRSAHEPVSSCATFMRTFRGKGASVRDKNSEGVIFGERGDRKDKKSVENVKDPHENETGVSGANENVPFQNEEVSAEDTAGHSGENNEDVLVERQNLSKDNMSVVNSEDLYDEEETLMDYEEGLYDDEDILMENEEDYYYGEDLLLENEDLHGEEEMPMDNEVSILGLEEVDLSVDRDLDYEVEMILGGLDKAFDEGEEGQKIGKTFREMEADLGKKEKEEERANKVQRHEGERASGSEKEVDIHEGGKALYEEHKEPWEEGEGLSLKMNKSVNKGGREGAPSTESLPIEETDPHMSRVRYVRQRLKPKTATGISPTTPTSGREIPSVRKRRMFLSSTNEPADGCSEARDDSSSSQSDLSLIEEAGHRTTANRPPVEKVDTVVRNDLSRWRDLLSHNISKAALYALVCVVFFVTAFQYDFLSCFAFYLITVYWLYIHGEKKRLQDGLEQVEDNKR